MNTAASHAFFTARNRAAGKYAGANLDTIAAAWRENEKHPGARAMVPEYLAIRDVLKAEADRFGLRNSIGAYVEKTAQG